jgi:chaperonin cofactor prefoldin
VPNQKTLTQQVKADLDAKILEIGKLKRKLEQTQQQLDEAQTEIQAMQSSKFWKLRRTWIKLKQRIGLSLKN